jgi:apolipoprotein N-acyltransferase
MVARYDKRKLVPFSEYMPVPILNRVDFGQASFTKGTGPGLFDQLERPFGVLICFESIFPGPSRELVAEGARYLVNITNDQWFGDSPAPYQHFAMNGLRCIENRVGMARAANTGISASIDPYGFVREATPTFVEERTVVPVELGSGPTFYTRHGNWILVAGVLLPLLGFVPGIRERSS